MSDTGDETPAGTPVEQCDYVNWGQRCTREKGHPDDGPTGGVGGHQPGANAFPSLP